MRSIERRRWITARARWWAVCQVGHISFHSVGCAMADVLLVHKADGVCTLTLNRPERRNALSGELQDALIAALLDVQKDASVRAVVLTGSGDKVLSFL